MDVIAGRNNWNWPRIVEQVRQAAEHVIRLAQEDELRLFVEWVLLWGQLFEVLVFEGLQCVTHFHQFVLELLLRPNIDLAALEILHFDLHFILGLGDAVEAVINNLVDVDVLQYYFLAHELRNFIGLMDVLANVLHFLLEDLLLLGVLYLLLVFLLLFLHCLLLSLLLQLHLLHQGSVLDVRLLKLDRICLSRLFECLLGLCFGVADGLLRRDRLLLRGLGLLGEFGIQGTFHFFLIQQQLRLPILQILLLLQSLFLKLSLLFLELLRDLLAFLLLLGLAAVEQLLGLLSLLLGDLVELLLALGLLSFFDDYLGLLPVDLVVVLLNLILCVVLADDIFEIGGDAHFVQ